MNTNKNKFICESVRLCRFLYGLGFDKESIQQDNREKWLFDRSPELQESLDFYMNPIKRLANIVQDHVEKRTIILT